MAAPYVEVSPMALRAVLRAEEQVAAALQALDRSTADTADAAMTALRAAHARMTRALRDLAVAPPRPPGLDAAPGDGARSAGAPSLADLVRQTSSDLESVRANIRRLGEGVADEPPADPRGPRNQALASILERRLSNVEERLHGIELRLQVLERLNLGLG